MMLNLFVLFMPAAQAPVKFFDIIALIPKSYSYVPELSQSVIHYLPRQC